MPQPIDFPTEMGRMAAVERIQQINDRLSLAALQRSTEELQDERVAAETQVAQTPPDSDEVDEETKRRNPFAGRRRHRQPDPQPEPETHGKPAIPGEPHQLDVSI